MTCFPDNIEPIKKFLMMVHDPETEPRTEAVRCDRCRHHDDSNTSGRNSCAVLEHRYGSPDPRFGIITTPPDWGCASFEVKGGP